MTSAIQHTVVFRLVHPVGSAAEAEFLGTARSTLPAIPGVEDFTVNRQVGGKSDLAWQFSMVFADAAAYAAYNDHPAHTGFVATRWEHEVAEFREYDFVVEQPTA
ncbi:MAG: Dabb family protein [Janthinobacterium lividum]